jgi:hypothetical protein
MAAHDWSGPPKFHGMTLWLAATAAIFLPLAILADFAPGMALGIAAVVGLGVTFKWGPSLLAKWGGGGR